MGKGSKQRPTNYDAFSANFDAIFGSKEQYTYHYECYKCGKLTRDEVSTYEVVDRVSIEATCNKCNNNVEEL